MKAQDLKNSIIQLAIQGKLVEQREEEGTAKELLEQIKAEKEKLIKEGKIKKTKALSEITEDEITFDIPESWEWVKLGKIVKITTGNKDANHGIENGKYDFFTCSKEAIKSNTYSYEGECILLPGNGANVGLSIYYQGRFEAYQRTYVLEKIISEFNMRYLQLALEWNWKRYNSNKLFGSAIPYIKMGNLENYLFPIPPLEEQKRIVAKIEELMPYVEKYDKAYTEVEKLNKKFPEDMQKSILQYAIQGKLVEQRKEDGTAEELCQQIQAEKEKLIKEGKIKKTKPLPEITEDEIPFDIPETWKWVRLGDVCTKLVDGDHNPPKGENTKTEYIMGSSRNINENRLVDLDNARYLSEENFIKIHNRTVVEKGDILFTSVGTLGRSCIFREDINITFQRSVTVISTKIFNEYLKFTLDAPWIQKYVYNNAKGTAQKGFYLNQMEILLVPIAPLAEQKRIVEKIEELLPYTKQLVKKID